MTKSIRICENNIRERVQREANPNFELPAMDFYIDIEVEDKTLPLIENDTVLADRIYFEVVSPSYNDMVSKVVAHTREVQSFLANNPRARHIAMQKYQNMIQDEFTTARQLIVSKAKLEIDTWSNSKNIRFWYKIREGCKVTLGALALVANVAGVVGAAITGGAGLILPILGTLKTISKILKECKVLYRNVEMQRQTLLRQVEELRTGWLNHGKLSVGATELLTQTVQEAGALLFNLVETFTDRNLVSISRFESDVKAYQGKLAPLATKAAEAGVALGTLVAQIDDLREKYNQIDRLLADGHALTDEDEQKLSSIEATLYQLGQPTGSRQRQGLDLIPDSPLPILWDQASELTKKIELLKNDEMTFLQLLEALKQKKGNLVKLLELAVALQDIAVSWASEAMPKAAETAAAKILGAIDLHGGTLLDATDITSDVTGVLDSKS